MFTLKLIAGPLIGALIGYCTNYIAVKMLFKPHHPVMIGKHRIPFTPGLIPKRKGELAGAIGSAIGDVLLTKKDLAKALPSEHVKATITDSLWDKFREAEESDTSVKTAAGRFISQNRYDQVKRKLENIITEKVMVGLHELDIKNIITVEGAQVIRNKVQGTMLSMMINDQVIQSVVGPVGDEIQSYIEEHGEEKIRPVVAAELARIEADSIGNLAQQLSIEKEQVGKVVDALYSCCVETSMETMLEKIDVAAIVEEKVQAMDVAQLEKLILSVMKKELNAIVNLGALIGLVIGLLNLAVSMI